MGANARRLSHLGGRCRGRGERRGPGVESGPGGDGSLARPRPPVMAVSPWAAAEEAESRRARVLWCAVGPKEASKCQQWSEQSAGKVTCATANTTEDCIALVLVGRCPPRDPASRARGTARL